MMSSKMRYHLFVSTESTYRDIGMHDDKFHTPSSPSTSIALDHHVFRFYAPPSIIMKWKSMLCASPQGILIYAPFSWLMLFNTNHYCYCVPPLLVAVTPHSWSQPLQLIESHKCLSHTQHNQSRSLHTASPHSLSFCTHTSLSPSASLSPLSVQEETINTKTHRDRETERCCEECPFRSPLSVCLSPAGKASSPHIINDMPRDDACGDL